jgi:hypothetical protein
MKTASYLNVDNCLRTKYDALESPCTKVKDVAKISTNKLSSFGFDFTFISQNSQRGRGTGLIKNRVRIYLLK